MVVPAASMAVFNTVAIIVLVSEMDTSVEIVTLEGSCFAGDKLVQPIIRLWNLSYAFLSLS
jgi:hypothetical protein